MDLYGGRDTQLAVDADLEAQVQSALPVVRAGRAAAAICADGGPTRASSSAASGTIHGEIDVAKDLPRNGPSGRYSHAWMSRADQSLTRQTPNTWSANAVGRHRLTLRRRHADDEADLGLDVEPLARAVAPVRRRRRGCPRRPAYSVPDTTTVPARPW